VGWEGERGEGVRQKDKVRGENGKKKWPAKERREEESRDRNVTRARFGGSGKSDDRTGSKLWRLGSKAKTGLKSL